MDHSIYLSLHEGCQHTRQGFHQIAEICRICGEDFVHYLSLIKAALLNL